MASSMLISPCATEIAVVLEIVISPLECFYFRFECILFHLAMGSRLSFAISSRLVICKSSRQRLSDYYE